MLLVYWPSPAPPEASSYLHCVRSPHSSCPLSGAATTDDLTAELEVAHARGQYRRADEEAETSLEAAEPGDGDGAPQATHSPDNAGPRSAVVGGGDGKIVPNPLYFTRRVKGEVRARGAASAFICRSNVATVTKKHT